MHAHIVVYLSCLLVVGFAASARISSFVTNVMRQNESWDMHPVNSMEKHMLSPIVVTDVPAVGDRLLLWTTKLQVLSR